MIHSTEHNFMILDVLPGITSFVRDGNVHGMTSGSIYFHELIGRKITDRVANKVISPLP